MKKKRRNNFFSHLFLLVGAFIMIFPLLWLLSSAFKNNNEIFSADFSFIPKTITLKNFKNGWYINPQYTFGHFLGNTLFLVGSMAIGNIISCSLTAFAITRMNFPLKRVVFRLVMLTLMVPSQVLLIPTYLIFSKFRWLDTFLPFIVPAFLSTQSFFVYQLIQYMRGIPKELDDSAKIDGCSYFRLYLNITLPLTKPALISVAIFSFVWTWNDFLTQLIYLNSVRNYTVSLILSSVVDSTSLTNWGALMALTLISVLPCIIIYFSAQRYFVEGITTSGLKG
ncbi:carbohydrate ABC transporter permease [Clostridiales bacterium COT073_COT-073]|nr:carbohydrate ABC transporter permease [Clostridiales bacterium COT073_COT-073]